MKLDELVEQGRRLRGDRVEISKASKAAIAEAQARRARARGLIRWVYSSRGIYRAL